MSVITITHQGRVAALAVDTRLWLAAHVEALPDGHPRKRWICFMALYARDVLTGVVPGPYTDHDAERYARACLIPRELLERPALDIPRAASVLELPEDVLRAAYDEHHRHDPP